MKTYKTYKTYSFGLSLAFTLIALAVASCSKDEIAAKLVPDKPTIVRKDGPLGCISNCRIMLLPCHSSNIG
jgi:hypothetical protein